MNLLFSFLVAAQLTTIADFGGEPTNFPTDSQIREIAKSKLNQIKRLEVKPYRNAFPVKSKQLSPGDVETMETPQPLLEAIFIIGYDNRSIEWLTRNKEYLVEINAWGAVVNVENESELNHLADAAYPLELSPMNLDAPAKALGLSHYPALIYKKEIKQ